MQCPRVAVIFGGQTPEHTVSLLSARHVLAYLSPIKYRIVPIKIDLEGCFWRIPLKDIPLALQTPSTLASANLQPDPRHDLEDRLASLARSREEIDIASTVTPLSFSPSWIKNEVDLIFPVLHGLLGEDGTVQSLAALAGVPCVGSGVATSALCMDKVFTKHILTGLGFRSVPFVVVDLSRVLHDQNELNSTYLRDQIDRITHNMMRSDEHLHFPLFIKPANGGSSMGVSRAQNLKELQEGMGQAAMYDSKLIIEEQIVGREFACGLLEHRGKLIRSTVGEIVKTGSLFTYAMKLGDEPGVHYRAPARLPQSMQEMIGDLSEQVFQAFNCRGMARVDLFWCGKSEQLYLNEINTIPGLSQSSLYPLLFQTNGWDMQTLCETVIESALRSCSKIDIRQIHQM